MRLRKFFENEEPDVLQKNFFNLLIFERLFFLANVALKFNAFSDRDCENSFIGDYFL